MNNTNSYQQKYLYFPKKTGAVEFAIVWLDINLLEMDWTPNKCQLNRKVIK